MTTRILPPTALPIQAEERLLSAIFGDPQTIYVVQELGVTWRNFGGEKTRLIAQAAWRCIDPRIHKEARTVDKATIILELQNLGVYNIPEGIAHSYVTRLDEAGTGHVVRSALDFARIVLEASIARRVAETMVESAQRMLVEPDRSAELYAGMLEETGRELMHIGQDIDYSIQAIDARSSLAPVQGLLTGIPLIDIMCKGLVAAESIGIQARQKGGKTRFMLWLLLRALLGGIPTIVFTTDGKSSVFRNRIVALIATAWLTAPVYTDGVDDDAYERMRDSLPVGAPLPPQPTRKLLRKYRAPVEEWGISPRDLDLSHDSPLTTLQRQAVEFGQTEMREKMRLYVLDSAAGIHDFARLDEELRRHLRPPFNCRLFVVDHLFDIFYRGSKGVESFQHVVTSLKSTNLAYNTTALLLNQRNEAKNQGRAGEGYGSYMGGALPGAVDHLFNLNDGNTDDGILRVEVPASRWFTRIVWDFRQEALSGFVLNPRSIPAMMRSAAERLPYHRPQG